MTRHLALKKKEEKKGWCIDRHFENCAAMKSIFPTENYFPTTYILLIHTNSEASENLKCKKKKKKEKMKKVHCVQYPDFNCYRILL